MTLAEQGCGRMRRAALRGVTSTEDGLRLIQIGCNGSDGIIRDRPIGLAFVLLYGATLDVFVGRELHRREAEVPEA